MKAICPVFYRTQYELAMQSDMLLTEWRRNKAC
jgi:hypothetical protein